MEAPSDYSRLIAAIATYSPIDGTDSLPMPRSTPLRTFAALGVSVASFSILQSLIVPILPVIQQSLHTTTSGVTWAMTAWLISSAVATPLLGRIGDLVGRKRALIVVIAAIAVGNVLAALAPTIGVLIIARVIQGFGGAIFPLAFGLLRGAFPAKKVPSAIGALSAVLAVASGLGTVLAGPLVGVLTWHGLFIIPLAGAIIGGILSIVFVSDKSERAHGGVNIPAALLLSDWLVALLLPLSEGSEWGWGSPAVIGLFVLTAVLITAWILVELKSKSPLVDMRIMRSPKIWPMNATAILIGAAMFSVFAFFTRFVQTPASTGWGLGASVSESGLIMLPMLVTMGIAGFISGPIAKVINFRAQVTLSAILITVSTVAIAFLHSSVGELLIEAAVFGLGLGLIYAALTSVVVQAVPATQTGIASGMNTNIRTIGSSIGVTIMTLIVSGSIGKSGIPSEGGYQTAFLTVAAFGAAAVIVSLVAIALARRVNRVHPIEAVIEHERVETTAESPFGESEVVELDPRPAA